MIPLPPRDTLTDDAIAARLAAVRARIAAAQRRHGRPAGAVTLVAVSKTHPAAAIAAAYRAGQRHFGESYLQEALPKIDALSELDITWHFIGAVQSNKTRDIAQHFTWVHAIDRLKIAERLHEQRPPELPPLNVCLQVNIGAEPQKAGVAPEKLAALAAAIQAFSRLRLRGLMALPPPSADYAAQRGYCHQIKFACERLRAQGHALDTLSMGMSGDLEAAIAEGATLVRIGAALFGARPRTEHPAA